LIHDSTDVRVRPDRKVTSLSVALGARVDGQKAPMPIHARAKNGSAIPTPSIVCAWDASRGSRPTPHFPALNGKGRNAVLGFARFWPGHFMQSGQPADLALAPNRSNCRLGSPIAYSGRIGRRVYQFQHRSRLSRNSFLPVGCWVAQNALKATAGANEAIAPEAKLQFALKFA
jgi:hypothetical protein